MIKKLFIIKLKDELRIKVLEDLKRRSKLLDEEELVRVNDILNKENISIDDVNCLIKDYLPYTCDNDKLIELIKDEEFISKIDDYIVYYIYSYLVDYLGNKDINLIMKKLGYKYKFSNIDNIDKYVKGDSNSNNEKIMDIVTWLYKLEEKDTLFKEELSKLVEFKDLMLNGVYPYELVSSFYRVKKSNNLYCQLSNIEGLYKNISEEEDEKNLLIIYYTYNYKIDPMIEEYFDDVNLEMKDIVSFIKRCEDKDIILNEKQIDNLLKCFKKRYYVKNGLVDKYSMLCNKVIREYSDYYDKHYYFSNEDFIKYYNEKYQDNFNIFLFSKGGEVKLNNSILSSLFNCGSLLEEYYLVHSLVRDCKTFKSIDKKREQYDREEKEFLNKKKKFYRKNKCKINAFLKSDEECINYFMLRNIAEDDRKEFFRLFKMICGDKYKEIGFDRKRIRQSGNKLKDDFLVDLFKVAYKDRMLVLDKYKEYIRYIEAEGYVKDEYFEYTLEEYERRFNIAVARNIIIRFRSANGDEEFIRIYESALSYVKNDLLIDDIDVIFNRLAKKRYAELRSEYDSFKSRYLMKKMSLGLVRRKSVK